MYFWEDNGPGYIHKTLTQVTFFDSASQIYAKIKSLQKGVSL